MNVRPNGVEGDRTKVDDKRSVSTDLAGPMGSFPNSVPIGPSPGTPKGSVCRSTILFELTSLGLAPFGAKAVQDLNDGDGQTDDHQDESRDRCERWIDLVAHFLPELLRQQRRSRIGDEECNC